MTHAFGEWTLGLDGEGSPSRDLIGGKAWSVARMQALGLSVPPAFVVTTAACRAYLASGLEPPGLEAEIDAALIWLEAKTGRAFGGGPHPLLVSVRSGAPISMPGMMDTVLNLGANDVTEAALAAECGDPAFARNTHKRFLDLYSHIVLRSTAPEFDEASEFRAMARGDRRQLRRGSSERCARAAAPGGAGGVCVLELAPRAPLPPASRHSGRSRHRGHRAGDGLRQS